MISFFEDLKALNEFGNDENQADYSRMMLFFIIGTICLTLFIYFTEIEMTNPGLTIFAIFIVAVLASAGGFLTVHLGSDNADSFLEQYAIAGIMGTFAIGYMFDTMRRQSGG